MSLLHEWFILLPCGFTDMHASGNITIKFQNLAVHITIIHMCGHCHSIGDRNYYILTSITETLNKL